MIHKLATEIDRIDPTIYIEPQETQNNQSNL